MLEQAQSKWQVILKHYAGVVAVAAIGLLLAAIIPIAGVFVCCCRCAGIYITLLDRISFSCRSLSLSLCLAIHLVRESYRSIPEPISRKDGNLRSRCSFSKLSWSSRIASPLFLSPLVARKNKIFLVDRSRQMLPRNFLNKMRKR